MQGTASNSPRSVTSTGRGLTGKGGTTLWKHLGDGFTVVVFQEHDDPPATFKVYPTQYDMIELRVLSALTRVDKFWDSNVNRVTHKKWTWRIVCWDPKKTTMGQVRPGIPSDYEGDYITLDMYDDLIEKAIQKGEKVASDLAKLRKGVVGSHKPWAFIGKQETSNKSGNASRFWCCIVYPDDFQWVVRINYGLFRNFGLEYPRFWELGYRFDSYSRAFSFAQRKMQEQTKNGYVEVTNDRDVQKTLRWMLRKAMQEDD